MTPGPPTDLDRAMTLTVGHVRAELADYFGEESTDSTEGYVARILARVRELEDEAQQHADDAHKLGYSLAQDELKADRGE